jgi:GNAT superfamily N-acetyltransferase
LEDQDVLYDIDLKCFDDVWAKEYWLQWFQDSKVIYIACIAGVPVGLAACEQSNQGILVEKLCVKPLYRRLGVARNLLLAVHLQALNYENKVPVHIVVPELWLYPGPDNISGWVKHTGFKATKPILPDYFCIIGESINGIKCVFEE